MDTITTDVAIIGAGTAGMTAYRSVKRAGKRAVLIESSHYGTTCARVGCMPSKLLIAAADRVHSMRTADAFGVHAKNISIDGEAVMKRVREERDRFVSFVLDDIDAMDDADKLQGYARFLSDTTLQVGAHTRVEAQSIIVATGSSPTIPENLRHLGNRVIINDDVFNWTGLPDRVLVVGAGVIGLELGQALTRLGVQTTIINRSNSLGGLRDPLVRTRAAEVFGAELDLRANTSIINAERVDNKVQVTLGNTDTGFATPEQNGNKGSDEQNLLVDYILMAAGRQPNLSDMGLENTSVRFDKNGRPLIDIDSLQLSPAPVFIAGDVSGILPVLHEAADEGYIAGVHAAAHPERASATSRRAPLGIVFSDPQLAYVGKRYSELNETETVFGEVDFSNQGRSRIMLKNYGMLRIYAQAQTGLFIGAEMAGPNMEHIAHLLSWAVQQQLTVADMLRMPFYHPVIEEGVRTALRSAARQVKG